MQRNPRQKKKSSQAKKRYYDTTKAKDSKTHQEKPPSDQHKNLDTQNKEPVHTTRDAVPVKDHKKYSKRKVASNWDRYEQQGDSEGQVGSSRTWESEEQLQQRLVQLLNLPVHHSPLSKLEHTITDETYSNIGSPFLTLDCDSLALALSSLPVCKRLDISQDLLELSQNNGCDHSEDQNTGVSPDNIVKETNTKGEQLDVDLKVLLTGQRMGSRGEFKFQVPPVGVPAVAKGQEPLKDQQRKEIDRDEELDSLLGQSVTQPMAKYEHTIATKKKVEITAVVTDLHHSSTPQLPSPGETDELDDMLDELLA